MQAFWDPAVVKHFNPADPKYATEPDTVQASLLKDTVTIPEVLKQMKPEDGYLNQIHVLQKHLLRGLSNASSVGNYSKMWEHSIYRNGYMHRKQSIWHTKLYENWGRAMSIAIYYKVVAE